MTARKELQILRRVRYYCIPFVACGDYYGILRRRYCGFGQRIFVGISFLCISTCFLHALFAKYVDEKCAACEFVHEAPDGAGLREEILSFDGLFEREAFKHFPEFNKFIYAPTCAGLGNQLYKFAAIFGLGIHSRRQPFFSMAEKCQRELEAEMITVFPGFYGRMHFYSEFTAESEKIYELADCCGYEMPEDLETRPERVIRLNGALQNYRWFHSHRETLRVIFECAPPLVDQFRRYNNELIGKAKMLDARHRCVCVHTRLGDFVAAQIATSFNYTVAAIERVLAIERTKSAASSFSVLLLGIDKFFLQSVRDAKMKAADKEPDVSYHIPKSMPRAHDMCYGISTCDTVIITAAASTFSWWMAYLAPNATVYYNTNYGGSSYTSANFLPEWIPLELSS